jgi:hypothetical protein
MKALQRELSLVDCDTIADSADSRNARGGHFSGVSLSFRGDATIETNNVITDRDSHPSDGTILDGHKDLCLYIIGRCLANESTWRRGGFLWRRRGFFRFGRRILP